MGKVRAVNWKYALEFVRQRSSEESLQTIFRRLTPSEQAELKQPYRPTGWVDYGAHIRFLIAADRVLGKGDLALLREEGIFGAEKGLHSVYKVFMLFASPQYLLKKTAQIWNQYYDKGRASVEVLGEKAARLCVTDYPDIPLHHDVENIGWMETALEMCQCHKATIHHPRCMARGDGACIFEATWI